MRTVLTRRAALCAGACLALAGCDEEPGQRRAFVKFLQTRILDKPGVHVPQPTEEERKSWGDYAKHYDVIVQFNQTLTERVSKPMMEAAQRGAVRSIQDLVDRRADVRTIQGGLRSLSAEVDTQVQAAQAARAALNQPADLKTVYDAAFERDVTGPAQAFKEVLPMMGNGLQAALDLADYLVLNRSRMKIDGSMIQIPDPKLQREVQARLDAMNATAQEVQAAQQRLRTVAFGS